MTRPEIITQQILESIGFVVKHFPARNELDSSNTIYREIPFETMRLDFGLLNAKIAIEVHGNYWHGIMQRKVNAVQIKHKMNDTHKALLLKQKDWKLIVVQESALLKHFNSSKKKLQQRILDNILV